MLTILLVGEVGVGKTAFLNLLANVLDGQGPQTYRDMHDASKEASGADVGSKTSEAFIYEFRSRDGIRIRLIDTPGLGDTRGTEHDEQHKANIVRVIRDAIFIDAILIVANGKVNRLQLAADYAIMTLASFFPRSIADNIAVVFTNVSNPLSFDFQDDSLPSFLRHSNTFLLDNPIAMTKQNKASGNNPFSQLQGFTSRTIGDAHANALRMVAQLFSWLDQCNILDTSIIGQLYTTWDAVDHRIQDALLLIDSVSEKKRDVVRISADISRATLVRNSPNLYFRILLTPFSTDEESIFKIRDDHQQASQGTNPDPVPQHSLFGARLLLQLPY
jgi:hypothetical protein